jgi:hypothetical protein
MKKIGLITYHATHNYGAVLQAYATQQAIEKLGHKCEIINFQPPTMKYFNALYKFPVGDGIPKKIKLFLAALYRFLRDWAYEKERKQRGVKFINFIHGKLKITEEYNTVKDLLEGKFQYDITITGSDQTWNIHCPLWRINNKINDYSMAYFLGFIKSGRKAAFAASTSDTTSEELAPYKDLLVQYDYIAVREVLAKERVETVAGKPVAVTLDPTFLLSKEEWMTSLDVPAAPIAGVPYVLLYSIYVNRRVKKLMQAAKRFAQKKSLRLVCVTPNACKKFNGVTQIYDAGPIDFLNLYHNASFVIAATFHAIIFSIIFRKPFLAFGNKYSKDDLRKTSLLRLFNLESRLITDENELNDYREIGLHYENHENLINEKIDESWNHLKTIVSLENI